MAGGVVTPPLGLNRVAARTLDAGELQAVFLPSAGMLCASLRHRGVELLRRVEDLDGAAEEARTAGIALLHPWANRLSGLRYRAAGHEVTLDPNSRLVHLDGRGLPMHGVPWSRLTWEVTGVARERVAARLDWTGGGLLTLFPSPHRLDLVATLRSDGLTLETTLVAGRESPVPVSLGFHPYFGLPGQARADWRLACTDASCASGCFVISRRCGRAGSATRPTGSRRGGGFGTATRHCRRSSRLAWAKVGSWIYRESPPWAPLSTTRPSKR